MDYFSHSQKALPALTDHSVHINQSDLFRSMPLLTDYRRRTLVALLQCIDADEMKTRKVQAFHSTHITQQKISEEKLVQTKTEPSLTQQEVKKTKGKEKEKGALPERSSMVPLLENLLGFACDEQFDFEPIQDDEMVEQVEPFPSQHELS